MAASDHPNIGDNDPSADSDGASIEPVRENLFRRGQRVLGIDRAIFLGVALRVWQLLAGLVTALLITQCFSEELQGYYYTFFNLAAMQSFFELGLFMLALNISSHEWAKLSLDEHGYIQGDADALSRLVSFGRKLFRWYVVAGAAFILVAGMTGYWFFENSKGVEDIQWRGPWLVFVLVSGVLLVPLPFNSMLEGCGQVVEINRFRLYQAIVTNIVVWTCMWFGGSLWTAVGLAIARLACELFLLCVRYRHFFAPFFQAPTGEKIDWRMEVLPLQWRVALTGIAGYFAFYLFVPVLFAYHGPVLAGQMGMTWMVMMAIQGAALAWVSTKVPLLGTLASERRHAELDRVFIGALFRGAAALALAGTCVWLVIYGLNVWEFDLRNRLLSPFPAGVFLVGLVIYQVPICLSFYAQAHKKQPFAAASIVTAISIGLLVFMMGSKWGAEGAAFAYLSVVGLFTLPTFTLIWYRFREQQRLLETKSDVSESNPD